MQKIINLLRLWRCANENCELHRSRHLQLVTRTVEDMEKIICEPPPCRSCGVRIFPYEPLPYSEADRKAFIRKFCTPESRPSAKTPA